MKKFALISILLLIIVLGLFAFWMTDLKNPAISSGTNVTQSSSTPQTNSEKAYVSVGDKLGGMTVTEAQPFNSSYGTMGSENIKLKLKGPIVITGKYEYVSSPIGFDGYCMRDFDKQTMALLPALPGQAYASHGSFCFRNGNTVKKILGNGPKIVTIKIDNYELNAYPSEVIDQADMLSVFESSKENIADPLLYYLSKRQSLTTGDHIYKIDTDISGDGFKEAIITDSRDDVMDGKISRVWNVYINNGDGTFSRPSDENGNVVVSPGSVGYGPFPGETFEYIVTYNPDSATSGVLIFYRIDNNKIVEKTIGVEPLGKDKILYNSLIENPLQNPNSKIKIQDIPVSSVK